MNQVNPVVFEFPCNDGTVRLFPLGILTIDDDVLTLDESFLFQGDLEPLGIVIQGRVRNNLCFPDAQHLG